MKSKVLSAALLLAAATGFGAAAREPTRHDPYWITGQEPQSPPEPPQPAEPRAAPAAPEAWAPWLREERPSGWYYREAGKRGRRVEEDDRRVQDPRPDDRRPRDHAPRWAPGRYPPAYESRRRHPGPVWAPPSGYFVRPWRSGESLPPGWYEPGRRLHDWRSYGLPAPPEAYAWVQSGSDAVLVELHTGRIVQVVVEVFDNR